MERMKESAIGSGENEIPRAFKASGLPRVEDRRRQQAE